MEAGPKGNPPRIENLAALLDEPLENEGAILDVLVAAQGRGQASPELWEKLHVAAMRDGRVGELAAAYERLAQDRRVKLLPPPAQAPIFLQAGRFLLDSLGDQVGAIGAYERVLALVPGSPEAFEALRKLFEDRGESDRLANLHLAMVGPKTERERALEHLRAALVLLPDDDAERGTKVAQQILRLEPGDELAVAALEQRLYAAGRHVELARLLEHALASDAPTRDDRKLEMRLRLLEIYEEKPADAERAATHVEAVLPADPKNELARRVATKLLANKVVAARAAASLEAAYLADDDVGMVAQMLSLQVDALRGPKKVEALKRLAKLQADLGHEPHAFANLEQALTIEPGDDEARVDYVALARQIGRQADATRLLSRIASVVKEPEVRAPLQLEVAQLALEAGESDRARPMFEALLDVDRPDVALAAARELRSLVDDDLSLQARILEVVGHQSDDSDERVGALLEVAQLHESTFDDLPAAIAARKLALSLSPTSEPDELERLLEAVGDTRGLAEALEIRALPMARDEARRELLLRAVGVYLDGLRDEDQGLRLLLLVEAEHGPSREVHQLALPLLEKRGDRASLAEMLASEVEVCDADERPMVLARLGATLVRLGRIDEAIERYGEAVDLDPSLEAARTALLGFVEHGEPSARLRASALLVPALRGDEVSRPLVRALLVRAELSDDAIERAEALAEAHDRFQDVLRSDATSGDAEHSVTIVGRGLAEALAHDVDHVEPWLARLAEIAVPTDEAQVAGVLAGALGDRGVDHPGLARLAERAAAAYAATRRSEQALALYRRVLAFEPDNEAVTERIDLLLAEAGTPAERVELYRASLARGGRPQRRSGLYRALASVELEGLSNAAAAVSTLRTALGELPEERSLRANLLRAIEATGELSALIAEWHVERSIAERAGEPLGSIDERLARLAERAGDAAEAVRRWTLALGAPEVVADATELARLDAIAAGHASSDPDASRALRLATARRRIEAAAGSSDEGGFVEALARVFDEDASQRAEAARAWAQAAEIAEARGDFGRAAACWAATVERAPTDRVALRRHAWARARNGEVASMLTLVERLLDGATSGEARELLSQAAAYVRTEELSAFDALLDAASALVGDALELQLLRSSAYAAVGRIDEAAAALVAALSGDVGDRAADALERFLEAQRDRGPLVEPHRALLNYRSSRASGDARRDARLAVARFELDVAGDAAWAVAELDALMGEHPGDPRVLDERLAVARRLADPRGAAIALRALLTIASEQALRLERSFELGRLLVGELAEPSEALRVLESVADEAGADPRMLEVALAALRTPASSDEAVALLARVARQQPDAAARAEVYRAIVDVAETSTPAEELSTLFAAWLECLEDDAERALPVVARAARAVPANEAFWSLGETLTHKLRQPEPLAAAYEAVLAEPSRLGEELTLALGERGVAFHEEWVGDSGSATRLLRLVVEYVPSATWAFERLKLIYNEGERWTELFELYDRIADATPDLRDRALVYEDAAEIAREVAGDTVRAITYLERLLSLRPADAKLDLQLERLYEKHARHADLDRLLLARVARQDAQAARATRLRVVGLRERELVDREGALDVLEPLVVAADPDALVISERWLSETAPPPTSKRDAWRGRLGSVPNAEPGLRARLAALLLSARDASGDDAGVARAVEVQLEAEHSADARRALLDRLAASYVRLGEAGSALSVGFARLTLARTASDVDGVIDDLLAAAGTDPERLRALAAALRSDGESTSDTDRAARVLREAARIAREELADESLALGIDLALIARSDQDPIAARDAARSLDAHLRTAGREADRPSVLERLAELEGPGAERRAALVEAARIAEGTLGDSERAEALLRRQLVDASSDVGVLTLLAELLERRRAFRALVEVLEVRAGVHGDTALARADHEAIARIHTRELEDRPRAIDAFYRVNRLYGASDANVDVLGILLEEEGRLDELVTLLSEQVGATKVDARRADLAVWLGDVSLRLGTAASAADAFAIAASIDPAREQAQSGLSQAIAALAVDSQQNAEPLSRAGLSLATAYAALGLWDRWLELVPTRLAAARSGDERKDVLLEAARIEDGLGAVTPRALERTAEAFTIDPAGAAAGLLARARATGAWTTIASTLLPGIADAGVDVSIAHALALEAARAHMDAHVEPERVESLLANALARTPGSRDALALRVEHRRRVRDRALIEALEALSDADGGDLGLLVEAWSIADAIEHDAELALRLGTAAWDAGKRRVLEGDTSAFEGALASLALCARLRAERGDRGAVEALYADAGGLPFGRDTENQLLLRAADYASDEGGVAHLQRVFGRTPTLEGLGVRLLSTLDRLGRNAERADVMGRLVELAETDDAAAGWRSERASLLASMERVDEAIASLEDTLRELPRHAATIEQLASLLDASGRDEALCKLLEDSTERHAASDVGAAVGFADRASELAESRLGDVARAARSTRRAAELARTEARLDRLASLYEAAGQPRAEAETLETLTADRHGGDAALALRLARAHVRAGSSNSARAALERYLAIDGDAEVRVVLGEHYRKAEAWEPLAALLVDEADAADDVAVKIEKLRESARLLSKRLGRHADAARLLERAAGVRSDDLTTLFAWAEALGAAGMSAQAGEVLQRILGEFGTRRPKERAGVHYQLGKLALLGGDRAAALAELEAATKIDPSHAGALSLSADIALDEEQYAKAQRTYRGLLMVLKSKRGDADAVVTRGKVLVDLAFVAEKQGESDRRAEYLEAAFEAAREDVTEWSPLLDALAMRGFEAEMIRAAEERIATGELPDDQRAKLELELAAKLVADPTARERAGGLAQAALARCPGEVSIVLAACDVLSRVGGTANARDALRRAAGAAAHGQAELLGRAAALAEGELGDLAGALDDYAAALSSLGDDASSDARLVILRSIERVTAQQVAAGALDAGAHADALMAVLDQQSSDGSAFGAFADTLYRLVDRRIELGEHDAAFELLERASRDDDDRDRAAAALERSIEAGPPLPLWARLLEDFARSTERPTLLVRALELLFERDGGSQDLVREAVETARSLGDAAEVERLTRRAVPSTADDDTAEARWALIALAELLEQRGIDAELVALWQRIAAVSEPDEARSTLRRAAEAASTTLGDKARASSIYEALRALDPADRAVWEPLATLYRELGKLDELAALVSETAPLLDDGAERAKLRASLASQFEAIDPERAASIYEEALDDEPGNALVAAKLLALYEQEGDFAKQAALVERSLDAARDAAEAFAVVELSTKLGVLREAAGEPDEALAAYQGALDWDPRDLAALRAIARLVEARGDEAALGDALERLLDAEQGAPAVAAAQRLAALRERDGDAEAAERALLAGLRASPGAPELRSRLAGIYEGRGDVLGLARLAGLDAQALPDGSDKKTALVGAARSIAELGEATEAIELYGAAIDLDLDDRELLFAFMDACAATSQQARAIEVVDRILDRGDAPDAPWLLFSRSVLREAVGEYDAALDDLDAAYDRSGGTYGAELRAQLEGALGRVESDAGSSRRSALELRLRLASVCTVLGDLDAAHLAAAAVLASDAEHVGALAALASLDEARGDLASATDRLASLVVRSEGDERLALADRLIAAARGAGRLDVARDTLAGAYQADTSNAGIADRLGAVYLELGAYFDHVALDAARAERIEDPDARVAALKPIARRLLDYVASRYVVDGLPELVARVTEQLQSTRPDDLESVALYAEGLGAVGRAPEGVELVKGVIAAQKGKRTREVGLASFALYRLEASLGDYPASLESLTRAFECQPSNARVALELGQLALHLANVELAQRAYRSVTLMKPDAPGGPVPQDKALAFLSLGDIAVQQGDARRARAMYEKALSEEPSYEVARERIAALG